ncbi:ParB/RepB/Spo0J family partition protein [Nitrospira sp. Kam-Ns4a]
MEKKALGKGLDALLPDRGAKKLPGEEGESVALSEILPNPYQPRTDFAEEDLAELADSIKRNGLLQPLLVRRKGDGRYELIAGERRLRAARLAGLQQVPVIVRHCTDQEAMEFALVENLQRKDLNPMETARAYHRLLREFGLTQDALAQRVGKDRSSVANLVRLVHLPSEIQQDIEAGRLTVGHAKALLALDEPEEQLRVARRIASESLSVRQAEQWIAQAARARRTRRRGSRASAYPDLEQRLQRRLGTRVAITKGRRGGTLVIHYFTPEDLDRLIEILLG